MKKLLPVLFLCLPLGAGLPVQNEPVPPDVKEDPFVEHAPGCAFTEQEKARRFALFARPMTDVVYQNTRFSAHERISGLRGWGARGQYVTLTFSLVPLADLKDLQVSVEKSPVAGELRQVCYWKVIFPFYNSYVLNPKDKRYRLQPEFLAPAAVCSVKARQVQRYTLTFRLPADRKNFSGVLAIAHAGLKAPVKLPFSVTVLPFELKQDPNKHYSAYNYHIRTPQHWFYQQHRNDPALLHKVQLAEFRRMREYGLTMPPTFYMTWGNLPTGVKDSYMIPNFAPALEELREAGFPPDAPIPVPGSSTMALYRRFTGLRVKNHHLTGIDCSKIPPELYTWSDAALKKWLAYLKTLGSPKLIFNPQDEPDPSAMPFVEKLYGIFKKNGCTTYITSVPEGKRKDLALYDVFCSGAFVADHRTAAKGDKQYWCYPNYATYQTKDMSVMCHGGRMVFGMGFWRSGYQVLIAYLWRNMRPFRLGNSGGQLLLPDGSLLMAGYWECYRQGIDDMRYIYTLEDAVVKRRGSPLPEVRRIVEEAEALLRDIWSSIVPARTYMYDHLLPHGEFDGRRAQLARLILKLRRFPESSPGSVAPSVIIDPETPVAADTAKGGREHVEAFPITTWKGGDPDLKSGELEIMVRKEGKKVIGRVKVNHANGKCWPSLFAHFGPRGADFSKFTRLEFDLKVDSDRDAESNTFWPLLILVKSKSKKEMEFFFTRSLEPGSVKHIAIPLNRFRALGEEGFRNVDYFRIIVCERDYPDKSVLNIEISNPQLTGFSAPSIVSTEIPSCLALPDNLSFNASVMGTEGAGPLAAEARLLDERGTCVARAAGTIAGNRLYGGFPSSVLKPGKYELRLEVRSGSRVWSGLTKPVEILDPGRF